MKRFLLLIAVLFTMLLAIDYSYGQATAGQHNPYQNLAKWYGTQSTPTGYEKAQWALDDINAYRTENGLTPLSESILKTEIHSQKMRNVLLIISLGCGLIGLFLFLRILYCDWVIQNYIKQQEKEKKDCHDCSDIRDAQPFPVIWQEMDEWRRRNNIGLYVLEYGREPTELELITGEIRSDDLEL